MTEMNPPPDLAQDFILMHRVITRGLGVSIKKAESTSRQDSPPLRVNADSSTIFKPLIPREEF